MSLSLKITPKFHSSSSTAPLTSRTQYHRTSVFFRSKLPLRICLPPPPIELNPAARTSTAIRSSLSDEGEFDRLGNDTEEEEAVASLPLSPISSSSTSVSGSVQWEKLLSAAASLYPLYVTAAAVVACAKPSAFSWFVERGSFSYSLSLGLIMLSMGLTLELNDLFSLFMQRPLSILFGCAAQYTIMPAFGVILSKLLHLSPALSVGLILLSCCPGGTASNVVTLIAQGDVALSVVMTVCTTLGAVILTPLLTKILAGTYVPVDALSISISTLQVVVAPILLGSYIQSEFPRVVKIVNPFAPLFAVLACSLVAGSVFSENVVRLKSSLVGANQSSMLGLKSLVSGELGIVIVSVLLLHFAGFFVGYITSAICGFKEPQRRAISIEVGMQNSSLGVVLATCHFASSPLIALPPAMSAVVMNIMGSTLGFFWRYIDPTSITTDPKTNSTDDEISKNLKDNKTL